MDVHDAGVLDEDDNLPSGLTCEMPEYRMCIVVYHSSRHPVPQSTRMIKSSNPAEPLKMDDACLMGRAPPAVGGQAHRAVYYRRAQSKEISSQEIQHYSSTAV